MSRAAELLQAHAEVMKLARLLGREPDELAYLQRMAPADLHVPQTAFVIEDRSQLGRLFAKLPRGRSAGIIAAAAGDGLWLEALDLLNHSG